MEWSEFARRLGRELAGLERDTILIVRERDESRHYVQAMREPDRLYAEAVSNNFLEGPLLLTLADEEVMSEAGWRPPADPAPRNWWTELPEFGTPGGMLAVTEGDFSRLADVMVTALRDVQGVRRPSDLVYESFHRHGTGLIELLDFGIDVADPVRVKERRSSSGTAAGAPGTVPAGADPLPAGTPPAGSPMPPQGLPGIPPSTDAELLEPRLAEAKANGDTSAYFRLLANADLVLPATAPAVEDPDRAELPTVVIGSDTYVTVFTSPGALARTGDRHPSLYRRTSFAQLASAWPDPAWRLAINWGLPSEVLLDSSVVARLHESPEGLPPAEQGVPSNPYGTVDPNALSGPNPVAGGSTPGLNGAAPSFGEGLHDDVPPAPLDDSHTAVDPFTAADLQAALDAGPPAPGKPLPPPADARPVPEPEPPAPQAPAPQIPEPQFPEPQVPESRAPEPQIPEPQAPESQAPEPHLPEPHLPEPQVPAPQVLAPQASAEPEPPELPEQGERLEPAKLEPEPKPEPEPLQPERLPHEHVQPQAERVQEGAVAPLGAPTRRRSVAQQQPPGVPIRLPHGARLWRWTGEGEETPLAVYDAVGGVWTPVRADAVQAPRTE
ncbi:hypothetical protein GCM10009546_56060 [Actinomadura livida]|uniref:SseB protein N-terminal domain-containing protein n=1 Tax=Actinomadura livida TaxID=79909 RepID=A0ABP3QD45_9ACTN|nr:hypothetical protein GCM10010208_06700 [Actinomadura livida]